jgi:cell division septum initiation protein DivIVA
VLTEERAAIDTRLDLLSLVDQLQEIVESSPRLPLSDRVVVSSDLLLDLVDALRATIPQDVIEAERILQERHRLVEDAREESEHLLESAREQSKFMLQEHHIARAAELKAERLLGQAHREADDVMASADDYVQRLFSRLEDEAVRLAGEIRKAAAAHRPA